MSFRMSSIQFMTNYQSSLNKTYQKQAKLLEQGDGSSIHRGSDDPVAYSKLLRYKISANENTQYTKNVQNAKAWMETTDSALIHIAEITKTFKEKTVEAATDVNGEADFDAIAKEMWAMIEEVYATSKTQHDGRYVFSGQMDKTEPFTLSTLTQERAVTKTLNASQAAFFKGVSNAESGKLYQMLAVEDDDGNVCYVDFKKGNIYSQNLVETGYQDYLAQGKTGIDDVSSDTAIWIYSSMDTATVDSDTAIDTVKSLLDSVENKTDADEAAEDVTAKLNDALYSAKYASDSYPIRQLAALYEVSQASDSDTQITQILTDAGITTDPKVTDAFKNFLTDNADTLEDYGKMGLSYYFSNQGTVCDSDTTTISLVINGEKKKFNIMTEPQQMIKYHGDSNYISMVKLNGATDTAADIVNSVGKDLFGTDMFDNYDSGYAVYSGSSMINSMLTVYNKVKAGDVKWLSNDGMLLADAANATVTSTQTTIGARLQLYTSVNEMLENQSDNITEEITNVSGTDVAKLATDLMEMTTLYNMALALGGRVLPQSLADYL